MLLFGNLNPLALFSAPNVIGLTDQTQTLFGELVTQWSRKYPRNVERMLYLDGKNKLKDLGIALPPEIVDDLDIVMGWPEKAVYETSNRIVWDGLTDGTDNDDPLGLDALLRANRFRVEIQQAIVSSVTHSLAFGSTTPGDTSAGEPDVMMMFHSALWATGLWDTRRRCLRAGLLINDVDGLGHPTQFTILLPSETVVVVKGPKAWYVDGVYPHRLGRVPMEHLPFRPTLDRPFGRSRIDRRVMSLTDRGMRNAARLEVHSELFSTMKLILMGADGSIFEDPSGNKIPLWNWFMGRMNTVGKDEDGDLPTVEQIKAESPEPHIASWRQLAAEFSGHTGVPLGSLGISTDNPSSSEQMDNVRESLIIDASNQHPVYGAGLHNLFVNAVVIRDRLSEPPADAHRVTSKWRNPSRPSVTSQSDAMVKQISSIPWLAETDVALEELGYNEDQRKRLEAFRRRMAGSDTVNRLLERSSDGGGLDELQAQRLRVETLGIARRAGLSEEDALRLSGLPEGLKFTGSPVAVRPSKDEAAELEDR